MSTVVAERNGTLTSILEETAGVDEGPLRKTVHFSGLTRQGIG